MIIKLVKTFILILKVETIDCNITLERIYWDNILIK
jgi:hypothetical protein